MSNPLSVPTQTPPHSPEYAAGWNERTAVTNPAQLQGWRDADVATIAAQSAPPPVQPPPVTPPVIIVGGTTRTIQPGENVVGILNAAVAHQAYKLVAGQVYNLPGVQVANKTVEWSLDATGAVVRWTLPTEHPTDPKTCFKLAASGAKFIGGTWTTNAALFGLYAATTIQGLTLTDGSTQFAKCDEQFGQGGAGTIIEDCTIGVCNSVGVFSTQAISILRNKFAGSIGEVSVRVDCTNPGMVSPNDVVIDSNIIHAAGTNQKGAVELRVLGVRNKLTRNTLYDYVRGGQDGMTTAGQSIGELLIDQNTFVGPGGLPENLMIKNGVITIGTNRYSIAQHPITLGGPAKITFNPPVQASSNLYNRQNVQGNVQIVGGY